MVKSLRAVQCRHVQLLTAFQLLAEAQLAAAGETLRQLYPTTHTAIVEQESDRYFLICLLDAESCTVDSAEDVDKRLAAAQPGQAFRDAEQADEVWTEAEEHVAAAIRAYDYDPGQADLPRRPWAIRETPSWSARPARWEITFPPVEFDPLATEATSAK